MSPVTDRPFPDFDAAFAWLAARTNYETMATQRYDARTYGLHRVERLLDELGRPETDRAVVQVVGSKGKGSTSAQIAAVLTAAGRRTGRFASPHLVHPRERITVDGAPVADQVFCRAMERLRPIGDAALARGEPCTFFELHTAAALLAFAESDCGAIVLEAGMGGRLDATTAAHARLVVLTNISLDHTQHLGDTCAAVAREKVAAARPGVAFLSGEPSDTAAAAEIRAECARRGSPLVERGTHFHVAECDVRIDRDGATSTTFDLHVGALRFARLETPMAGSHQADNAALAAVAALRLELPGESVGVEHVRAGLAAARLPARLSVHGTRPLLLVDGAHSPASLAALGATLSGHAPEGRRVVVFGMAADKDLVGAAAALARFCDHVVATTSGQPRAAAPETLAALLHDAGVAAETAPDVERALVRARELAGAGDTIVVTGSLYLCGAFLASAGGAT